MPELAPESRSPPRLVKQLQTQVEELLEEKAAQPAPVPGVISTLMAVRCVKCRLAGLALGH
jgi:hypothetical protein